jgi:hypothetical protein
MPKSQKKTAKKDIRSTILDCEICGARAAHVVVARVISEYTKVARCVLCWHPFKIASARIEHVHDPEIASPHSEWRVTSSELTEFITDLFIGAHEPETTALAHAKCAKRVLSHWPDAARPYKIPVPSVAEVTDKMIERGVHLQALEDLKVKLKDALLILFKNVSGSSSEYGCPCASRVSNTLSDIADKFQQKEPS